MGVGYHQCQLSVPYQRDQGTPPQHFLAGPNFFECNPASAAPVNSSLMRTEVSQIEPCPEVEKKTLTNISRDYILALGSPVAWMTPVESPMWPPRLTVTHHYRALVKCTLTRPHRSYTERTANNRYIHKKMRAAI